MTDTVNDFLLGGGAASAKFPTIGTVVKGTITQTDVTQQTDFSTGALKFWDDAKTQPMMQVVVTLKTDERDPTDDSDEGLRKLYVKGQMQAAVREALRAAQAKLEVGGTLAVQYTSDKPAEKRGHNPAKQYTAQYKPPSAGTAAANDLLGADDAPAVSTSDLI